MVVARVASGAIVQAWRGERLQDEGVYPPAFAIMEVPVLMVHATFDPHPGRLITQGLRAYLPQLECRETAAVITLGWKGPLPTHSSRSFASGSAATTSGPGT